MLFPILLLYVTSYVSAKFCDKNQYWSTFLERCENCSRCTHPDIVIRPCQRHKDTVCGPLSELNVDWSFLRHPDSKDSNPQKEMLQTFKENFEGIRQHEKHVNEMQKLLREGHRSKDSEEDYNEIEGGDILVGHRPRLDKKQLWEKLKEFGRSDPEDRKGRERSMKLLQTLLHLPAVLDSFTRNKIHFDDDEAFELFRDGKKKKEYDPNDLKFDENGILLKDFGFSKPDSVKVEKLVGDGSTEQKATEKAQPDWRLVLAAGLLITHTIIILIIITYCMRKNGKKLKGYFAPGMGEVQTWILPKDKERNYPSSGVYKPTTEVRTGPGKCRYLERIINMNGKKKVNFYVGMKLPSEMKPLTGVHKAGGDRV